MSAISDPRVVRSRAAVVEAATTLFLEKGYVGTTMEDIAAVAGIARRTLYNNYPDKAGLFREIVSEVIAFAEDFARRLSTDMSADLTASELPESLHDLGQRLARGILRPEVVALRRLLIGEAREFPDLAREYYDRAPGRVIVALAELFERLDEGGLLEVDDARRAAEQFAYLVAGEPLDRAVLVGKLPTAQRVAACARAGVDTFLVRYTASGSSSSTPAGI